MNPPFLGFVCYQWLDADFASPRSCETLMGAFQPLRAAFAASADMDFLSVKPTV
jgi:hypothetical protein